MCSTGGQAVRRTPGLCTQTQDTIPFIFCPIGRTGPASLCKERSETTPHPLLPRAARTGRDGTAGLSVLWVKRSSPTVGTHPENPGVAFKLV
ncbi:hypothetical protein ANANG_G00164950 [Anguilla anguilla]|uniref:Uncharacterized protein n=1 Tax=Anguilla anguilla TaxID=7936 RepID=A0A9D3MAN0_ANGAN|nr:hypothetical protein ANANG_G00164950 [Anguilla anguilla]